MTEPEPESMNHHNHFPLEQWIASRENLRRVLDNLRDGIIAHDLERRILFFNREAERITGIRREEILGKDCHDVMGGPLCGAHCSFCGSGCAIKDKNEYTIRVTAPDGATRLVEMTVTPMKDDHGAVVGVIASLRDASDLLRLQIQAGELASFANIIGRDPKMIQLFQQIRDVAGYDFPVHIAGETGTGKELVAAAIHSESRRCEAPFVPINCGALPENLIESELFGHVKGAFSGAIRDKKGRFELADGGAVFLDEVAELSKPMQVKLLRFLQEGTFEKVGGERTIRVDVRIISATNKDLRAEVERDRFREDLYYRLNVIPLNVPPLRERKNDIPLLADHFLKQTRNRYADQKVLQVSREAMALLLDYPWPGNVRELQNAIQHGIVKAGGPVLAPGDLPLEILNCTPRCAAPKPARKLDVEGVRAALDQTGGNKSKAAALLGVGRATLYRFLDEHPHLFKP